MRRKILIYLAGPISPYKDYDGVTHSTADNVKAGFEHYLALLEAGFAVYCPHLCAEETEASCKCTYDDYLAADFTIIERCDAMFMLPDWQRSKGSIKEREFALSKGIPLFYDLGNLLEAYPQ